MFTDSKCISPVNSNTLLCDLVTEKFLENIHTMLNEPSVGLYRVQEHVRRSLPQLVDKKVNILEDVCVLYARLFKPAMNRMLSES